MDTLKVKVFLQIAQHKSFSKVARDLSYTPSALSHMADALEKELKLQLFERTYRGVELTEAGRKLSVSLRI
jgi:DNA-binding transcriptional LysR family regulator